MNILFLTMFKILNVDTRGIYSDLLRRFREDGHTVYVVTPSERRDGNNTRVIEVNDVKILSVRTLNVEKSNVIEKGLGQISIEYLYKRAIKKYFSGVSFDLILYSTPPITLSKVIEYLKRENPYARTYLLLKDIFPQNAVDMGMLSKNGIKGILYKFFRTKEQKLYALSDYIGCMSPANVSYVLEHNPEILESRVEVAPNSLELVEAASNPPVTCVEDLPNSLLSLLPSCLVDSFLTGKPVFIYGGNLGVPQGIPFLIECLEANADRDDCHFLVVGTGTYSQRLADWYGTRKPKAVSVMKGLPKEYYDMLVQVCQVGLIFLDYRFTIPNFPSRLLSYLEYKMPIIACTDSCSDIGSIAESNGFGFYVPSNNVESFSKVVTKMLSSDMVAMGKKGYQYLKENYLVENTYNQIMKHL